MSDAIRVIHGDCLQVMPELAAEGVLVDACVCDPPYHLTSIVKRFAKAAPTREHYAAKSHSGYMSRGFMGKTWDGGDIAAQPETWRFVFDLLKPGAHLIAFGGTRTYHRMACAIEDAGFEIRDQIGWLYASGFPKSHDVAKGIDKAAGAERQSLGPRTDGRYAYPQQDIRGGRLIGGTNAGHVQQMTAPATAAASQWEGWGTALKPAWEPIVLARKPLRGTVAANVQEHGTGAINIDGCRVATTEDLNGGAYSGSLRQRGEYTSSDTAEGAVAFSRLSRGVGDYAQPAGRWPANVIHDGSEEVLAAFAAFGESKSPPVGSMGGGSNSHAINGDFAGKRHENGHGDAGTAARFFYSSKADSDDRLGSKHPTVKPVDLMAYLCRLVTPPGGQILDPFAGSGATGMACMREGFRAILIEKEEEYYHDILRRLAHVKGADTPLFAAAEREPSLALDGAA